MRHPLHQKSDNKENRVALEPAIFVIFGVTGDLAQKRLLPALYHLLKDNLLHEDTEIVGVSRRAMSPESLLASVELCVLEEDKVCDPATLERFRKIFRMVQLDPVEPEDYVKLQATLDGIETTKGVCMNRLFYLAIPPHVYGPVISNLGLSGLQEGCQHKKAVSRLLVEKPFGYDLASAEQLIAATAAYFRESQVFRIDHYLAKETVQNILFFRHHNPIFSNQWHHDFVSLIEIEMFEQVGVEGRADFYEGVGALRDIIQNHLLQLLALTTMELPTLITSSKAIHFAKHALLAAVRPLDLQTRPPIRAQYGGYREAVGNPHSYTETFASVRLNIENTRWNGVPIILTTGKAMASKYTTISLTMSGSSAPDAANRLTFRVQPNEGIDIELIVKRPGYDDHTEVVQMDFSYNGILGNAEHPDAYERVLVDAVRGDHSLFATSDEILASWRALQPILDLWHASRGMLTYAPGSDGPDTSLMYK